MNALHQHMIDLYRAARLGEAPPPPPGRDDVAVLREARDRHRDGPGPAGRPGDGSTGCGRGRSRA
ncbi:hypothetical protein [Streptomyces ficellus]|uniref:Uncharacterized protein n=1 Tax=Streptomyces ficellus TaxID=1977088 RepID=A0A6I6FNS9_9ACTN|nr:hypothetical protein [Streptomyces ficellus]QGV79268.1 hypothetical protein EIZ62_14140 [Streptomyces ficellus]